MANNRDIDKPIYVIDGINYSIIANADSPERLLTGKFFTSGGSGIFWKGFNFSENAKRNSGVEAFEFFSCRSGKSH